MNDELRLLSSLLPEDEHLSFDELDAAARGAENDHLQWCDMCAREVVDLRAFAELPLAPPAGRGWREAPGEGPREAPGEDPSSGAAAPPSPLERGEGQRSGPRHWPWRLFAAAAVLVVVASAAFLALRARDRAGRLRLAEVPIPAEVVAMRGEWLQLRGRPDRTQFSVLEPIGTAVVPDRPLFRWSAPSEWAVRVEVYDERFRLVAQSGPVTGREWSPPEPLPRDRTYVWQVVSADGHSRRLAPVPPLPDARFRVVSAEEARRIEAAKGEGPSLELASRYAGAGALDDARRELDRLGAEGRDGEAVRRLRDRVDNLR